MLDLRVHDLRDATTDVHRTVDDAPFGGGAGHGAACPSRCSPPSRPSTRRGPLLLLGPGGRRLDQAYAAELAALDGFSLLCGRYEGVDERVRDHLVDGELSIGDYVLAGGEVAAMVVLEAVGPAGARRHGQRRVGRRRVLRDGLLEYPQYTRPAEFRGWEVPEVLRSGDHGRVARWRRAQALARTLERRPDLLDARGGLTEDEQRSWLTGVRAGRI